MNSRTKRGNMTENEKKLLKSIQDEILYFINELFNSETKQVTMQEIEEIINFHFSRLKK